jgi:redox-sensitive bicupin YhaK (pirin superfamily)
MTHTSFARRGPGITLRQRKNMITLRKSADRGHAEHGWLDARHTFSFADYHDPGHTGFRALRVINEDRVAPKMGFGLHPHRDMEIITYVVSGALQHRDSMGHSAVMRAGDVQRISAGSGIRHSEVNASDTEPVHLLQIWLLPDRENAQPSYAEKSFAQAERGRLHLVASKAGRDGSLSINQDTDLWLGQLDRDGFAKHQLAAERHAWVQVIRGDLDVNGETLHSGDAARLSEEGTVRLTARTETDFLLFDLN